jgi:hypothetical protein
MNKKIIPKKNNIKHPTKRAVVKPLKSLDVVKKSEQIEMPTAHVSNSDINVLSEHNSIKHKLLRHTAKYAHTHWTSIKNSFEFDSITLKLILLDVSLIFTLMLSYVLIYFLWVKNLFSVSNILSLINSGSLPDPNTGISSSDLLNSWNNFIFNVILIIVVAVLLYIIIISIYSALGHKILTRNKFSLKLFLNFLASYALWTLIYILSILLLFHISTDIIFIAWIIISITLLYLYALLIFYITTSGNNLSGVLLKGLKSMLKLHHAVPVLLCTLILFSVIGGIMAFVFQKIPVISVILIFVIVLYSNSWIKRYMHQVLHS